MNFQVPTFSYDIEIKLKHANEKNAQDGTLIEPGSISKSAVLERMAETIFGYKAYPSDLELDSAAKALINTHPCLREPVSPGHYGWKTSLKFKMGNYRSKLRISGRTELSVNSLQAKRAATESQQKNVKKPRKAEVNYLPNLPEGETADSLEEHRVELVEEVKKRNCNEAAVADKMAKTFSKGRLDIIVQKPLVTEVRDRWPALSTKREVSRPTHTCTCYLNEVHSAAS